MKFSVASSLAVILPLVEAVPGRRLQSRATCNVRGFDKAKPLPYSLSIKPADTSLIGCATLCTKSTTCKSYAVGAAICFLYTSTVSTNFNPISISPFVFYDKECSTAVTPPPTSEGSTPNAPGGSQNVPAVCGAAGLSRSSPQPFYLSILAIGVTGCRSLCVSKSGCLSFAVGQPLGINICLLYKGPAGNNFDASSGSPFKFYDLSCGAQASPSPARSSSTPVPRSSAVPSTPRSSAVPSTPRSSAVPSSSRAPSSSIAVVPSPSASSPPRASPPAASTPAASTPAASTPAASTPAASTPAASTPAASTPAASTPAASTPAASTPAASTPAASTPAASTPAASTPAESTPAASTPAASTPAASTPAESTPVASTPAASTPEASTPAASTPEASTPAASTPAASTPAASTPAASTPAASTPAASTPEASTPAASTPAASTPEASTPVASTPAASTPAASTPAASTPPSSPSDIPETRVDVSKAVIVTNGEVSVAADPAGGGSIATFKPLGAGEVASITLTFPGDTLDTPSEYYSLVGTFTIQDAPQVKHKRQGGATMSTTLMQIKVNNNVAFRKEIQQLPKDEPIPFKTDVIQNQVRQGGDGGGSPVPSLKNEITVELVNGAVASTLRVQVPLNMVAVAGVKGPSGPIPSISAAASSTPVTSSAAPSSTTDKEPPTSSAPPSSVPASSSAAPSQASSQCLLALASPTVLAGNVDKGSPGKVRDQSFSVPLDFPVTIFTSSSTAMFVNDHGTITFGAGSVSGQNQVLPSTRLQSYAALPFWAESSIAAGSKRGIFYSQTGAKPNRQVTVEWLTSPSDGSESKAYHFTARFSEATPGVVTYRYYTSLDAIGTIGVQGGSSMISYSANSMAVSAGTQITFNTGTKSFSVSQFDVASSMCNY